MKELLKDNTAGDPVSGVKWTNRSLRKLQKALRKQGFHLALNTIARLLRQQGYSLRTNRKRRAGTHERDRDRQFRYIARMRQLYQTLKFPVISVDAKKKELVGNFKNPGRRWRRKPQDVLDHDFPSWAIGKAIPYGIYDFAHNDGYVVIGTSHETATFAVAAIRRWWIAVGRKRHSPAKRLLIQADSGGSNGCRRWEWKLALQHLADEFGLIITVTHYPSGASKWNPIDHRMFSLISGNWAGEPLTSYELILKYIRATRSETGFQCRASLDHKDYSTKVKVTPAQKATIRLKPHRVLPRWNYTILPHQHRHESQ
ncbi:MAG: ISAzo13 family transposase [Pirellulales bacterium]|nr:ISAzo13 family transposase [Pirellulales bacterium]